MTMSNYRWYREMFLSKIFLRSDGVADNWNEIFISGLARLFAKKVKINIKQKLKETISYK